MRRFVLVRAEDVTGVSGIGEVAQGVKFESGKVVMEWRGSHKSVVMHDSIHALLSVHGHEGRTRVDWLD